MKWNFLYQITAPRSPFSLSSLLNWICRTPEQNSWARCWMKEKNSNESGTVKGEKWIIRRLSEEEEEEEDGEKTMNRDKT